LIEKSQLETAHRLHSEISAIFAYAIVHGFTDYDPAQPVTKQIGMLNNVTECYHIPIMCSRGWSDLHSRAALLKRCARYDIPTVVLMFGDHDSGGLSITASFKDNLDEVLIATGLETLPDISLERVGLNAEDINALDLLWIDGLETSSGKDLSHTSHPDHKSRHVQEYLELYGARKCEANALLRSPEAAEKILLKAINRYIDDESLIDYQDQQLRDRQAASQAVEKALAAIYHQKAAQ
jgi:hypothetical protein